MRSWNAWSNVRSRWHRSWLRGFDREVVTRIDRLLNIAEYKRRQAAPGVKVTEKNFGRDRRYPITNKFRDSGKALPETRRNAGFPRQPRVGGSFRRLRSDSENRSRPIGSRPEG